jgi:hypothetical protein
MEWNVLRWNNVGFEKNLNLHASACYLENHLYNNQNQKLLIKSAASLAS